MKKEKVAYANGEFVNYKLETQKFIICAVSEEDYGTCVETNNCVYNAEDDFDHPLKRLSVGVSITSTKDTYDEEVGKKIAYSKAKSTKSSFLITNRPGFINEDVVSALLTNYVKYVQKDPGSVIAGYDEAKKKYLETLALKNEYKAFTEEDKNKIQVLAKYTPEQLEKAKKLISAVSK